MTRVAPTLMLLAAVAGVAGLGRLPAALAAQPDTGQDKDSSRPGLIAEQMALPHRPPAKIGQVIGVAVEGGFLHVSPRIADDTGPYAMTVADWPGFVKIDQRPGGLMFSLLHVALDDSDTVETHTFVATHPDYLQLTRQIETPTTQSTVTLLQSRQFPGPGDEPVSLRIRSTPQGGPVGEQRVVAATFAELCRDQPDLVRTHLLPILKDLGAQHVLRSSDTARAWQVLGALTPPDPQLARTVDTLLERLGGDDFADRARAEDALARLGAAGAVELRRRDLSQLPPDPRSAVENVLRAAEPLEPRRAAALADDVAFLVDTLWLDEPKLVTAAAGRLKAVTGKAVDLPPGLEAAEKNAASTRSPRCSGRPPSRPGRNDGANTVSTTRREINATPLFV